MNYNNTLSEDNKIILFIVEGHNDEVEIRAIMDSILPTIPDEDRVIKRRVFVKTTDGDITSKIDISSGRRITPMNIVEVLDGFIDEFVCENQPAIRKSDIGYVFQIVDTDGAFISSDNVKSDSSCIRRMYRDDYIFTAFPDKTRREISYKQDNLEELIYTSEISSEKLPYRVFYVSCNMDHVLFDNAESSQNEKKKNAEGFGLDCSIEILKQTVLNPAIASNENYDDSWIAVKQGNNSIRRKTNLNILISRLMAKNPRFELLFNNR